MAEVVLFNSNEAVAESLKLMENHIREFTRAEVDDILMGVRGLAKHLGKSDEELAVTKLKFLNISRPHTKSAIRF